MDDGRQRSRDEHERQCIDACADRAVDPGMLVVASIVFAGDAGSVHMARNTDDVVVALVVLTVMRNAVRQRCDRGGEAGREQDE